MNFQDTSLNNRTALLIAAGCIAWWLPPVQWLVAGAHEGGHALCALLSGGTSGGPPASRCLLRTPCSNLRRTVGDATTKPDDPAPNDEGAWRHAKRLLGDMRPDHVHCAILVRAQRTVDVRRGIAV